MMRKSAAAVLIALCMGANVVSAQGFGVGAHIGTTGVGGDVAIGLGSHLALHGSIGTIPIKPNIKVDELEFKIEPPKTLMTIGADFFPGAGSFHLMGGLLAGAKETDITGIYTGTVTFGDHTYQGSQLGTITGLFETSDAAPFVGIGFGRHAASGFGLTLDLGVGFMGEPTLTLTAPQNSVPASAQAQFQADLEKERVKVFDKIEKYAKLFPMVNIGIRIGL